MRWEVCVYKQDKRRAHMEWEEMRKHEMGRRGMRWEDSRKIKMAKWRLQVQNAHDNTKWSDKMKQQQGRYAKKKQYQMRRASIKWEMIWDQRGIYWRRGDKKIIHYMINKEDRQN